MGLDNRSRGPAPCVFADTRFPARLQPAGEGGMPHSLNSPFALRLGLVKGVASVPLGSSFACAWIHQVDTLYHIR